MYQDNLAILLPKDERKALGSRGSDKFRGNIDRRAPRMKRIRDIYRHFTLEPRPKSFPFQGCANVQLPLMTAPVIQHHSRLFDMVYAGGGRIATVVSPSYYERKEREVAERFFNHYILHEMPEFAMGLDASLFQSVLVGSSFRRTHWDEVMDRCRSEWIPIEDFVAPPGVRAKDPSMRNVAHYSVITRKSLRQIRANKGYVDAEEIKPGNVEDPAGSPVGEKSDRTSYTDQDADLDTPRIVIEHYFKYLAPKREKKDPRFDGQEHPAYACIDLESETLLSLVYREEDDPNDLERYAREFGQYQQGQQLYGRAKAAFDAGLLPGDEPKKPNIPEPKMRKREVPLCTHYSAYPSEGFYGLGLGDFLLGPTRTVNTVTNQSLDAATVRIARPGYISRQLRGPRGGIASQPGQLVEIDAPMGAIKDGIYYPDMPPGDPFMQAVTEMVVNMAQNVTGSYSTMAGQIPGSNQAAQSVLSLIEEARMPITVMAKRTKESLRHELEKIWRCLGTFLPDSKMQDIIGPDGQVENVKVSAVMFGPDSRLFPTADARPRAERVQDAQQKLQFVLGNPLVQMGMQTGQPAALDAIKYTSTQVVRMMGDERLATMLEAIMPPGPPPPPPGMGPPPGGPPGPGGPPPGPPGPPPGPPPGIAGPPVGPNTTTSMPPGAP